MGCYYSRLEREEMVSRCKARKRYMKQFVKARNAFSASHTMYLRSLRNTGAALLQFATAESPLHLPPLLPSSSPPTTPAPPPPPPPMSPSSEAWTTSTANTSSTPVPPPPPPPPPPSSTWDFWDPFMPISERTDTVRDDDWEDMSTNAASETVMTSTTVGSASVAAPLSVVTGFSKITVSNATQSEMPVAAPSKSKVLLEIIKELDEYFLRAADSGGKLSALLEVPSCTFPDDTPSGKIHGYGMNLNPFFCSWSSSPRSMKFGCDGMTGIGAVDGIHIPDSHRSTVERLFEWEKKLFDEVKNAESLKMEHEKRVEQLRKLDLKRGDYMKTEKAKKEVEKLESRIMVLGQAIESTSQEIVKLRETELYPQLVELVKGLMSMWRSLYESHQVQTHIVQQLKYVTTTTTTPSTAATTEIHRQSTLQLELEVQQWHLSFCNLIKSQRDYIQSLTGWLRLSLFQFSKNPSQNKQDSAIYTLCEEWQLAVDNAPDKVASEGINALLSVVHAIVVQQGDEMKQKRRADSCCKEVEKRAVELRAMESKYGSADLSKKTDRVVDKRAKVEALRAKAEEEKGKYEKSRGVTRAMTLNNLQMGLPHVFQAVTGFANVWTHAFESVSNQAKIFEEFHDVKRLMN